MGGTWIAFAAVEFAVLCVFTYKLLHYYATKNTPWVAWITVFLSWYLGFFGTLFLPIDIAEAYVSTYLNVSNITIPEAGANETGNNGSAARLLSGRRLYDISGLNGASLAHMYEQARNTSNGSSNGTTGGDTWVIETDEVQIRNGPLETMWMFVYWMTFILTYLIIPFVQEYVAAGDFTRKQRLITSVKLNGYYYLAIGVVAIIALGVVLAYGWSIWELFPILISLANTYGLVFIVLLMGYGASEVPRSLWRRSQPREELRRLHFTATEVEAQLFDARSALNDIIAQVKSLQTKINALANDPEVQSGEGAAEYAELRRCLDIVLSKCTVDYHVSAISSSGISGDDDEAAAVKAAKKGWRKSRVTMAKLASLHKQLMSAQAKVAKNRFRWERHVLRAIELEYVLSKTAPPLPVMNKSNLKRERGGSLFGLGPGDAESAQPDELQLVASQALAALNFLPNMCGGAPNRWMWHFRIRFAPITYKLLAFIAEVMSILVLWSEATIWINLQGLATKNLSVFGLLLQAADASGNHSYAAIQFAAAIPLAYMCIASAYTLFKLKLFDFLDMSGNQNTDPYCLCFNATLFNRLQFSLAFNYLNVLMHSSNRSDFPSTAFLHSVGARMKLSQIDWYLPMLMVVVYALARLNIFERIMRLMGVDEKGAPIKGNIKHDEMIADGQKLITKTKRSLGLDVSTDTSSGDSLSAMDRLRAMGRAGIAAGGAAGNGAGDIELSRRNGGGPYEPPASAVPTGPGRRPAGGTVKSSLMSLDAFTKPGGTAAAAGAPRSYAPSPAPAPASSMPSWSFDEPTASPAKPPSTFATAFGMNNAGRAPAPAPAASSSLSTKPAISAATTSSWFDAAPSPAPAASVSTGRGTAVTSASRAAPAAAATSGHAGSAASFSAFASTGMTTGAGTSGGNLAALLRGKRAGGPGYGQLE